MMEGKRVTLEELSRELAERNLQEAAERDAWLLTDEGKAWEAEQRRLVEADMRYAAEHPEEDEEDEEEEDDDEEEAA